MSSTMKAVDIKGGAGPIDALYINTSAAVPVPKAGDALVKIKAFGLNRMDLLQREGRYPLPPQAPSTLGVEFSGTIESFGPGPHDSDFKEGDEVFGLGYGGAYAEQIAVSAKMLLRKPPYLSWEQAAGVPETWITAIQALHVVGEFARGKRVLWHAGASGVSIAGIQLSRDAGAAAVFATAGSDEKCAFVERELGATKAVNYKTTKWDEEILKATDGKGVDLIVDFVGASYFQQNLNVAAQDARWVLLGLLGGTKLEGVDIAKLLMRRIRLEGSTLRSRDPEYQGRLRDKLAEYIPHFENGKLKVLVEKVLPMEEIQEAHRLMESNKTTGKIICTV